jgi:adenosylhomocysteine nucleosidase
MSSYQQFLFDFFTSFPYTWSMTKYMEKIKELRTVIPSLLCVEMEGAAAAQVCFEYNVPFVSIRSISDNADDEAGTDFLEFVNDHAAPVSRAVVEALLSQ